MVVYKEKDLFSSKTELLEGTPVIAIATDAKNGVELQYANGEKGWNYIDGERYPKQFGPLYPFD